MKEQKVQDSRTSLCYNSGNSPGGESAEERKLIDVFEGHFFWF